ncbi:MAG TPA: 4-hydroxy-3-methylbut-2-enyl diphosphate reductase [Ferruginibacter sp.]|nr:4-hydroxy-3-methylbut-2-enyl diphosphate reductase [Ferruginibacter sp.]HRO17797.1 4-hydroxy-3-methylbut-2-enyl diphosphate reductase [Ferruginibacter sp.]HRQ20638.1 4-hydroxy-3-methylbut-2-enyl diphosphate reductase [Ferruginibacter sp.]
MKQFTIPFTYRSSWIAAIKQTRKQADKMKKDFTPSVLDFGPLQINLARHFGFCYGVENAIEIAFRTVDENPGKRIFLLSEMIHNPQVNADLTARGVRFLQDTSGNTIIPFDSLHAEDIVLIPAFGTTLAIEEKLTGLGIAVEKYNTTCPFVEKVWNRSEQIARQGYTVVVHGKPTHEETRATFSHAAAATPTLVISDMKEAEILGTFITAERSTDEFDNYFAGRYSSGFNPSVHLKRIGVVNQTTMLASDTQGIADYLKQVMIQHYTLNDQTVSNHFADTRDTLCYATNDNQSAVYGLLEVPADLAIVVGGYNSSNTSHLVELCEEKLPTYFINSCEQLLSRSSVQHFNLHTHAEMITEGYLPTKEKVTIAITSGASCPDALVESVIKKLMEFFGVDTVAEPLPALSS